MPLYAKPDLLYFDAKLYGAAGNGTTDDTAAIAAAISVAGVAGGIVYLQPGIYVISAPLALASKVAIQGAGRRASILKATAAFGGGATHGVLEMVANGVTYDCVELRSLGIDMTAVTDQTTNRINAVYQDNSALTHFVAQDLYLDLVTGGQGILFNGLGRTAGSTSYDLTFRDIYGHNGAGTVSIYANCGNEVSTYHDVVIDNIVNLVDIAGVVDDRVAVVGAQPNSGNPTATVRDISVSNVFTVMTAAAGGLVNGVKIDSGNNCCVRGVTVRDVFFLGNGTSAAAAPFICLIAGNGYIQDVTVDGVVGINCGAVRGRFRRFDNSSTFTMRNITLTGCIQANYGVEIFTVSAAAGDERILIDGVSVHTAVSTSTFGPVGVLLTSGAAAQGASGQVAVRNVVTKGYKTGISNNITEAAAIQATAYSNLVVSDCNFVGATAPTNLVNTVALRGVTGIADIPALRPGVALAETTSRVQTLANQAILVSGRLHLVAIGLTVGTKVTSITFVSGTTAVGTATNQWFALLDNSASPALLGQTADDTSTAWAANATKTLTLSAAFTATYTGIHYLGIMVAATTVPSLMGVSGITAVTQVAPVISGSSTTGLTTPASFISPASAPSTLASGQIPYAYVS